MDSNIIYQYRTEVPDYGGVTMSDSMMWALVKEKPEEGLWMKKVPVPEVGPNDVKIKIHKTAICGTDVHIYQWND